ncbi:DUF3040 domain-containing protein [Streptacidiphilus monticola]|jgi:hypothetical protein|uniref:DUF3040 domain-containing protein n=1 Tax=Streptacidiphilus monticola TaxID=2161674 RepID=A0ABW1GAS3_9ACTN
MDRSGAPLSSRERRILAEIETALRADEDLERSLSTMHPLRRHHYVQALGKVPVFAVLLLCTTSVALAAVAAEVWRPQVLFLFGLVWAATLAVVAGRLTRHLAAHLRTGRAPHGNSRTPQGS